MTEQRIAEIKQQAKSESPYVVKERTDFGIKSLYIQGSGNRKTFVYSTGSLIEEGFRAALINDMCRQLNAAHQAALIQERLKFEQLIEVAQHLMAWIDANVPTEHCQQSHDAILLRKVWNNALSKFKQQKPTEG